LFYLKTILLKGASELNHIAKFRVTATYTQILGIKSSDKLNSYVNYNFVSERRLRGSASTVLRKRILMAEKLVAVVVVGRWL
jgi:hypothetical protein